MREVLTVTILVPPAVSSEEKARLQSDLKNELSLTKTVSILMRPIVASAIVFIGIDHLSHAYSTYVSEVAKKHGLRVQGTALRT